MKVFTGETKLDTKVVTESPPKFAGNLGAARCCSAGKSKFKESFVAVVSSDQINVDGPNYFVYNDVLMRKCSPTIAERSECQPPYCHTCNLS